MSPRPGPDLLLQIYANMVRMRRAEERDVTVITTARMVGESLAAALQRAGEGISVEVIDPRSLVPPDRSGLAASVRKTHRVVIAEEGPMLGSVGAWQARTSRFPSARPRDLRHASRRPRSERGQVLNSRIFDRTGHKRLQWLGRMLDFKT